MNDSLKNSSIQFLYDVKHLYGDDAVDAAITALNPILGDIWYHAFMYEILKKGGLTRIVKITDVPGGKAIPFIKCVRKAKRYSLSEAKAIWDKFSEKGSVEITFEPNEDYWMFISDLKDEGIGFE